MNIVTDYVAAGSFADLAENVVYQTSPDYAQLVRTTDLKNGFTSKEQIYVNKHAFNFLWRVNLNKECIIMPNIGNCGEIYYISSDKLPYKHNVLGPNAIFVRSENNDNKFLKQIHIQKHWRQKIYQYSHLEQYHSVMDITRKLWFQLSQNTHLRTTRQFARIRAGSAFRNRNTLLLIMLHPIIG